MVVLVEDDRLRLREVARHRADPADQPRDARRLLPVAVDQHEIRGGHHPRRRRAAWPWVAESIMRRPAYFRGDFVSNFSHPRCAAMTSRPMTSAAAAAGARDQEARRDLADLEDPRRVLGPRVLA